MRVDLAAVLGALRDAGEEIRAEYTADDALEDWLVRFLKSADPRMADGLRRALLQRHRRARAWMAEDLITAIDRAIGTPRPIGTKLRLVIDNERDGRRKGTKNTRPVH